MALGTDFRKLWTASAISNLGDGMRLVAFPLAAAAITRDPGAVAAVGLAQRLPWLLLALVGGAIADRVDRRRLMIAMQLLRMLLVGGLALVIAGGLETIPILLVAAFALGTAEVAFDSAAQSILPSLVATPDLEGANSRLWATETIANEFAGGPLGGALFSVGAALPFAADAVSFGLGAALLGSIRGKFRPRAPSKQNLWRDIREGLQWLWRHRLLRTLAVMVGVVNMTWTAGQAILVLFAFEELGVGAAGFGLLIAPLAVGGVIGTLLTTRVTSLLGPGRTLFISVLVSAVSQLGVGMTSSPFVVAALWIFAGAWISIWNVVTVSLRQAIIPDHLLGRVNSVYRLLAWGTIPIGAALGGLLAEVIDLRAPFLIGGAIVLVLALVTVPVVNTRNIEAAKASSDSKPTRLA